MPASSKTFSFGQLEASAEFGWLGDHAPYSVLVRLGSCSALASCEVIENAQHLAHQTLQLSFCKRSYAQGSLRQLGRREDQPSAADLAHADFLQSLFAPVLNGAPTASLKLHVHILEDDPSIDPKLPASLAISLCLSLTGLVQGSPKVLVQLAVIDGHYQVNPPRDSIPAAQANLWVFGDTTHLLHVDGSARELDETRLISALAVAHDSIMATSQNLGGLLSLGKPAPIEPAHTKVSAPTLLNKVRALAAQPLVEIFTEPQTAQRKSQWESLHKAVQLALCLDDEHTDYLSKISTCFQQLSIEVVRSQILGGQLRVDRRAPEQMREPRKVEVGRHTRAHGSASVSMADSMLHSTATLGINRSVLNQLPDAATQAFNIHSYLQADDCGTTSTAQAISHWLTAALRPVIPSAERFPYAIRVDCEHWGLTGAARQDCLYGATLALMDAGVALKASVAAVEVGLIHSSSQVQTLSDPQDFEREACDLNATLAGTQAGLTAIHIRNRGVQLTSQILAVMLQQARQNRLERLLQMSHVLAAPRTLNPQVPRAQLLRIAPNQTGLLVGRGGTTVRALCEDTQSQIEVFPDGRVLVSASSDMHLQNAIAAIEATLHPIRVGQTYPGTISALSEQGALITLAPGRTGLLRMPDSDAVPEATLKVGAAVRALCTDIDQQGRVWLALKALSEPEARND